MTLPIMAPELPPVRYTRSRSMPYLPMAYSTMLAMACESPPPLCVSERFEDTSQHVPELGDDGQSVM